MALINTELDLAKFERRARIGYELARARRAVLGFAPMFVIVAIAFYFSHRPGSVLAFGAAEFVLGACMLWYGKDPQRAVLPGVVAGLFPLGLALGANYFHHCGAGQCSSLCLPACCTGGVLAGLLIALIGHRRKAGAAYWFSASSLTLLTGAMGCSCIGYSGLLGLAAGMSIGVVPGWMKSVMARSRAL
jgi:hypothetical protein